MAAPSTIEATRAPATSGTMRVRTDLAMRVWRVSSPIARQGRSPYAASKAAVPRRAASVALCPAVSAASIAVVSPQDGVLAWRIQVRMPGQRA